LFLQALEVMEACLGKVLLALASSYEDMGREGSEEVASPSSRVPPSCVVVVVACDHGHCGGVGPYGGAWGHHHHHHHHVPCLPSQRWPSHSR